MALIKIPEVATDEAINTLKKMLISSLHSDILKMVFFGSRKRGKFSPDSDIDILVVVTHKTNGLVDRAFEIGDMIEQDILNYEIPITMHIITGEEYQRLKDLKSPFILSIEREGMVIYERTTQS